MKYCFYVSTYLLISYYISGRLDIFYVLNILKIECSRLLSLFSQVESNEPKNLFLKYVTTYEIKMESTNDLTVKRKFFGTVTSCIRHLGLAVSIAIILSWKNLLHTYYTYKLMKNSSLILVLVKGGVDFGL